jgi:hypothetical protein
VQETVAISILIRDHTENVKIKGTKFSLKGENVLHRSDKVKPGVIVLNNR